MPIRPSHAGSSNSLIVAGATAVIATLLGFGAAYVDYRYRFFGKGVYTALMTLPPTIPVVILGLAMLTFEGRIGITGTLSGIVAGHVVLCMPFALALVRLRLADLDPNLEAASWNLGATRWTTMRDVIIPFCFPAIVAALFLTAAISFDEYMIAWFVSGLNETLPVRLAGDAAGPGVAAHQRGRHDGVRREHRACRRGAASDRPALAAARAPAGRR